MKRWMFFLMGVVIMYVGFGLFSSCDLQAAAEQKKPATVREVILETVDDVMISAKYYVGSSERIIIVLNGWLLDKDDTVRANFCQRLMNKGFSVLNIDLRGYGKSSGEFSGGSKEVFDLKAAIQFAREKKYRKMGVIGFGFGGSVAIRGTLLIPEIKSVVTIGTPYTARVQTEGKPNWASNGLARVGEFLVNSISRSHKIDSSDETLKPYLEKMIQPILVIHGKKDKLVSYAEAEQIYRAAAGGKSFFSLEGADHADALTNAQLNQIIKRTAEWFNGTLK